jgi:hypothetical protein
MVSRTQITVLNNANFALQKNNDGARNYSSLTAAGLI